MEYRNLGQTGLSVSRLCFGSLTVSPLQANLPLREGAGIIRAALEAGVNFIDTAELYRNYGYIRTALKGFREPVIITSKSYAYAADDMRRSVETACRELGRDYVDIFMLHEQISRLTLHGHKPALDYLVQAKRQGLIRAVGVSTHMVEVVQAATLMDEIDVIHPIYNMAGIGICDGTVQEMAAAIEMAAVAGKGIYTMKALGGGHLSGRSEAALSWILAQPNIHAVAVGMQSEAEVRYNCARFAGNFPDPALTAEVSARRRRLLVEEWCAGCGTCVKVCPMGAMQLVEGRAVPQTEKCVLCGYCGAHCPEFCIKVI